ncbi:MAG: hypothetical protein L0211_21195, partial [Planctomycetaceae bacterium]|nr:hypothetical protein [Planctomycetaceae bacterium]
MRHASQEPGKQLQSVAARYRGALVADRTAAGHAGGGQLGGRGSRRAGHDTTHVQSGGIQSDRPNAQRR